MPNMNRIGAIAASLLFGMPLMPRPALAEPVDIITFDLPGETVPTEIPTNAGELATYLTQLVANGSRFKSHERFDLFEYSSLFVS